MKYAFTIACCILLFSNCFDATKKQNKNSFEFEKKLVDRGNLIANTTFRTLGSNLQKAMKEGGVSNAVKYCNLAASPLVDSLEQVHQVKIKRTSLKTRNQNNKPTVEEKLQLEKYHEQFEKQLKLNPVIRKHEDEFVYYAPIHVMPLCQKCHGTVGKELKKEDYQTIQSLYPNDRAVNYNSGDLRGMWSINFIEPMKN